jgi:hypothetical protein
MAELKPIVLERLTQARHFYTNDFNALSHDQLATSPGGKARSGYDFTFEVITVNNRIATQLKGEDPGEWPFGDDWATCPAEDQDKEQLLAQFHASVDQLVTLTESMPDDKLEASFMSGERETSFAKMGLFAGLHMMYHCAQLSYIQAIHGDEKFHWM